MFIELTNAAEMHKGNKISINPAWITAVYDFAKQEGGSLTTIVYGGPQGTTWEVEESYKEVTRLINSNAIRG